ncbi:MAG: phage portal protein [Cellvibrionaceae bacterium]|nr:phage portal protein [Cellvibrionaceae bacterium]
MKIFSRFRRLFGGAATRIDQGSQLGEPEYSNNQSGQVVTEDTALQLSAVWACSKLLAEVFASLPVTMYERSQGIGSKVNNDLTWMLTESPNSRMTGVEFYETMQLNLGLRGNCYARIARNTPGKPVALWPLPAQSVEPVLLENGSVMYYYYQGADVAAIADKNMLHIRLFGNGLVGLSPMAYASNTIGLGQAAESYAAKQFSHGGKPSGVLYTDADLTKQQRELARQNFAEITTEREENRRLLVLPLGFKYQQVQLSPGDLQLHSSRQWQIKEICRFMGNIPPVLIGENSDTTTLGSSIEHILIAWYRLGLNPYATRWEQALAKKLLTPIERRKYAFHVDFDALTRGDSKTQMELLKGLVGGPVMTPNEGRALKNLPPVAGGDRLNPAPTESRKETSNSDNEVK